MVTAFVQHTVVTVTSMNRRVTIVTYEDIMAVDDDQSWELNNTALKSIRQENEEAPGVPASNLPRWGVPLFENDPHKVLTLERGVREDFWMREPYQEWSWKK